MTEDSLIDRIMGIDIFHNVLQSNGTKRIIRLLGEGKMGKSRLLREYRRLAVESYHATTVVIDLGSQLLVEEEIMWNIASQIDILRFPNYQNACVKLANQTKSVGTNADRLIPSLRNIEKEPSSKTILKQVFLAFLYDLKHQTWNNPLIIMFDTFEKASTELQTWIYHEFINNIFSSQKPFYIVIAGRTQLDTLIAWHDLSVTYSLKPVTLEDYQIYCRQLKTKVDDAIIEAFHRALRGVPGLFIECISNLTGETYEP